MVVEPGAVRLDLVVDRTEISTRQTFPQQLDDRTGRLPGGTEREVQALVAAVSVTADGPRWRCGPRTDPGVGS